MVEEQLYDYEPWYLEIVIRVLTSCFTDICNPSIPITKAKIIRTAFLSNL